MVENGELQLKDRGHFLTIVPSALEQKTPICFQRYIQLETMHYTVDFIKVH